MRKVCQIYKVMIIMIFYVFLKQMHLVGAPRWSEFAHNWCDISIV